jgi:hypothetical protein
MVSKRSDLSSLLSNFASDYEGPGKSEGIGTELNVSVPGLQ